MAAPLIRILSDLHYRDGESALQHLPALLPLLDGADQVVLNGDTLDNQSSAALPHQKEAMDFFARHAPGAVFLSGNHDPDISAQTELSLLNDRVWITHGDVLFPDIAPWSGLRGEMLRRLAALPPTPDASSDAVRERLARHRIACTALPTHHDCFNRDLFSRAARLVHALIPPHRLIAMCKVWRDTPKIARQLARAARPRAQLVVLGHTHFPGVWRDRHGPVVVNTGSFCRPFGGMLVELRGDDVRVLRITRKADAFHPGRVVSRFSLATT